MFESVCLFLRATPENVESSADYARLGPLSDGRTCHSVLPRGANFGERMCSDDKDDLREVVTRGFILTVKSVTVFMNFYD